MALSIGKQIIPLLVEANHEVLGLTRNVSKISSLTSLGAKGVVCNVYDQAALETVISTFKPDVVISQLTDLPDDISLLPQNGSANARIRREGTHNLLAAIAKLPKVHFICQSVAWNISGPGGEAVNAMEQMVLDYSGVVIRYGQFYGPYTYYETEPTNTPRINIKDAARMTLQALTAPTGIYIADDSDTSLQPLKT